MQPIGLPRPTARHVLFVLTLTGFVCAPTALGGEVLPGPVPADLVRVIDGDTILVRARIWLGQVVETRVRLQGIDAPELRGQCRAERDLARRASAALSERLSSGRVVLRDIQFGKFARRVVARVESADGTDVADLLVSGGLARAYDSGRRPDWCERAKAG